MPISNYSIYESLEDVLESNKITGLVMNLCSFLRVVHALSMEGGECDVDGTFDPHALEYPIERYLIKTLDVSNVYRLKLLVPDAMQNEFKRHIYEDRCS